MVTYSILRPVKQKQETKIAGKEGGMCVDEKVQQKKSESNLIHLQVNLISVG